MAERTGGADQGANGGAGGTSHGETMEDASCSSVDEDDDDDEDIDRSDDQQLTRFNISNLHPLLDPPLSLCNPLPLDTPSFHPNLNPNPIAGPAPPRRHCLVAVPSMPHNFRSAAAMFAHHSDPTMTSSYGGT